MEPPPEPASAVSAADKSAANGESERITGVNTLACETEMAERVGARTAGLDLQALPCEGIGTRAGQYMEIVRVFGIYRFYMLAYAYIYIYICMYCCVCHLPSPQAHQPSFDQPSLQGLCLGPFISITNIMSFMLTSAFILSTSCLLNLSSLVSSKTFNFNPYIYTCLYVDPAVCCDMAKQARAH